MRVVDLIIKKRNGFALTKEEIDFIISGYVDGSIPDYQISALMMAIYFNPLNDEEKSILTTAMLKSGEEIDLSLIDGVKVDKHSTGGVGDKTSLVVGPIASAAGIKIAKMSGRGLGHTGGTLDKLESIPGFKIEVDKKDFLRQVNNIGLAIIGQTANITPADKKLYALRDVTGTIESRGLIAASIMSKKLASGADNIVLDVKVGSGAFMKNFEDAKLLAIDMVKIGSSANRKTVAVLTNMEQPLGNAIGNRLEVIEAIETLKGNGPKDFTELCIKLASEILLVSGLYKTEEESHNKVIEVINNGSALNKLKDMIKWQHGDASVVDDYSLMNEAEEQIELKYQENETCYVEQLDALKVGEAVMILGAGRATKEDVIDYSVGIVLNKKVGDCLKNGDVIAILHTNGKNTEKAIELLLEAYTLSSSQPEIKNIILDIVR
ncbi:MAG: pyrimidine-nucleoside phosphorylase [Bacilli bacterium]|nr:pyrimidine-nucleoside phosphorylase [Bacilli bacterium]